MFRGQKTQIDYPHINLEGLKDSNALYNWLQVNYNHYPLSEEAYNVLKNFEKTGEVVRVAGRVLLVAGIVLDALEIGTTMYSDLNDADGRLGKKTISTVASIGGSWGGSIVGANVGAAIGVLAGPAAPIAVPVLGIVGGIGGAIGGAIGGEAFAEWVVDITCLEG